MPILLFANFLSMKIQPIKKGDNFYKFLFHKSTGFTLIELIIVITILTILTTIAFISFENYTKDARDGNRISTLKNIQTGLVLYNTKTGYYPTPEEHLEITWNWWNIFIKQWLIKWEIAQMIKLSNDVLDPKDNTHYIYSTNENNTKYQLWTYLEENKFFSYFPTTYANIDYTNRYFYTLWEKVWILLDESTKKPIQEIYSENIDLNSSNENFIVSFSNSWTINGSWGFLLEEIPKIINNTTDKESNNWWESNTEDLWLHCSQTSINNYNLEAKNNWENITSTKTDITFNNWTKVLSQNFLCTRWSFEKNWEETQNITCDANYIENVWICILGACSWERPENSIPNGTQWTGNWSWDENSSWICKYKCNDWYESENCTAKTKIITSIEYASRVFNFSSFTLTYNIPQTQTSQELVLETWWSLILTVSFKLEADWNTVTLSNQNQIWKDPNGLYWQAPSPAFTNSNSKFWAGNGCTASYVNWTWRVAWENCTNYKAPTWNGNDYVYPNGLSVNDYPAFKYCRDLWSTWRLPTVAEWVSIKHSNYSAYPNINPFLHPTITPWYSYWTSDETSSWEIYMINNYMPMTIIKNQQSSWVFCVKN